MAEGVTTCRRHRLARVWHRPIANPFFELLTSAVFVLLVASGCGSPERSGTSATGRRGCVEQTSDERRTSTTAWDSDVPDRFVLVLTLMCVLPSAAHAADGKETTAAASDHTWGINIWGLSYHVDRDIDYDETNCGIGVRYYTTPPWKWLGSNPDNRVFLDADALRNSNRGLLLPLSAGAEFKLSQLFTRCKLFAVGAFTVAYYGIPTRSVSEVRLGPVPGLAIGCGHVKVNSMAVFRASREPLAAITASMTVMF